MSNEAPGEVRNDTGESPSNLDRRAAIKAFVGLGLASGLTDCTSVAGPAATPSPPLAEHDHPAEGDVLVFAFGDEEGQVIAPSDVPLGGPQLFAYPADARGGHVASGSRLNQVVLVRVEPSSLTEETAARAADGIVAYSAMCTHEGCDISDWNPESLHLVCPCHDSEFDPKDNGRATEGPARRRLAALPLRVVDGTLTVGGGFVGRVGFRGR